MKKILSIDGGGIRGIIPASTLVKLEQQANKPVRECFDFIAGTSTGAFDYRDNRRRGSGHANSVDLHRAIQRNFHPSAASRRREAHGGGLYVRAD